MILDDDKCATKMRRTGFLQGKHGVSAAANCFRHRETIRSLPDEGGPPLGAPYQAVTSFKLCSHHCSPLADRRDLPASALPSLVRMLFQIVKQRSSSHILTQSSRRPFCRRQGPFVGDCAVIIARVDPMSYSCDHIDMCIYQDGPLLQPIVANLDTNDTVEHTVTTIEE